MGNPFWPLLEGGRYKVTHYYKDGGLLLILFELRRGRPPSKEQIKKWLSKIVGRFLLFRYWDESLKEWGEEMLTPTSIAWMAVDRWGKYRGDICVAFRVREWADEGRNVPSAEREGC